MLLTRERLLASALIGLLCVGSLFGGGQIPEGVCYVVELFAAAALAIGLPGLLEGRFNRNAIPAMLLAALLLLLPLLQIMSLPVTMFSAIPGRSIVDAIRSYAGLAHPRTTISLDTSETLYFELELIVPLAAFILALQLSAESRRSILLAIAGLALLSAIIGILQLATGGQPRWSIYPSVHEGLPIGFFANRNHQADLMLVAIAAVPHLALDRQRASLPQSITATAVTLFLVLLVIATQSRTGITLIPVAIVGAYLACAKGRRFGRLLPLAGGAAVALAALALVLSYSGVGGRVMSRFGDTGDDLRMHYWTAGLSSIKDFWPYGTGAGTFPQVYEIYEDLDFTSSSWVNHAHNDYIEFVSDFGLAGAILIAAYAAALIYPLLCLRRQHRNGVQLIAFTGVAILLVHSVFDYPLRTFCLSIAFAILNAFVLPAPETRPRRTQRAFPEEPQPSFMQLEARPGPA